MRHPIFFVVLLLTAILVSCKDNAASYSVGSDAAVDTPDTVAVFSSRIIDTLPKNQQFNGYIKIYFGKTHDISPLDPYSYQYMTEFTAADLESGIATIRIYRDSLIDNGFK